MQEPQIRSRWRGRRLTIPFLVAAGAALASCATQPKQTALVDDPTARPDSSIPWNKPATWEGRANFPGGIGAGTFGDPGAGY